MVCLCGSTRFRAAFELAARDEALAGRIVLSLGVFSHAAGEQLSDEVQAGLAALHRAKIEMADEILVLNVGGYCGDATREELEYARQLGKTVRYLEPFCSVDWVRPSAGLLHASFASA